MSWSSVPQVVMITSTMSFFTMSMSTPRRPVATIAAGNERNFVQFLLEHILSTMSADVERFFAMKPPERPICLTIETISSERGT